MIGWLADCGAAAVPTFLTVTVLGLGVWCAEALWKRMPFALRSALWFAVLTVPWVPRLPASWSLGVLPWAQLATSVRHDASHETAVAGTALSPWLVALGCVWAVGVLYGGLALLRRLGAMRALQRRLTASRSTPADAVLAAACEVVASRLHWRGSLPRVVASDAVSGPAVVGWIRPVVVVPEQLLMAPGIADARSKATLLHVLTHEFVHVQRRDPWLALISAVLTVLSWPHPLAHFAQRRLRLLRELSCDAVAVASLPGEAGGHSTYRETLLELARPLAEGAAPALTFGGSAGAEILVRLRALDEAPRRRRPCHKAAAVLAFAVVLACCAPRAMIGAAPAVVQPEISAIDLMDTPGCLRLRYAMFATFEPQRSTQTLPSTDRH